MCASVNRNKPVNKRPGTSRNSSRRSSIANSARSSKSARGDELNKLLNEHARPIATFQVPTVEHKKDLHAPHLTPKTHVTAKTHGAVKHTDHKREEKDKKTLKKVKKPEGKGFFNRLLTTVKRIFG